MLIPCPACAHAVSPKAPMCPHCGHPVADSIAAADSPSNARETTIENARPTREFTTSERTIEQRGQDPEASQSTVPDPHRAAKQKSKPKSRLIAFLLGTTMIAWLMTAKWVATSIWIANGAWRENGRQDFLQIGVWGTVAAVAISVSFTGILVKSKLARFWTLWVVGAIITIPLMVHVTYQVTPGLRVTEARRYKQRVQAEFTPERIKEEFGKQLPGLTSHADQTITLSKEYSIERFTIPSGLPPVETEALSSEDLGDVFRSGVQYFGRRNILIAKVECYSIKSEFTIDPEKMSKAIDEELLNGWNAEFSRLNQRDIASMIGASQLDSEQQAVLGSIIGSTRVMKVSTSRTSIDGVPSYRSIFKTESGFPFAARSEILVYKNNMVNVLSTAISMEELTDGPSKAFFESIRVRR